MDDLSMATRRQRENILRQLIETAGNQPVTKITTASLEAGRDRRSVHQGRHFLDAMRGLFRWAAKAKLAKDPTLGVEDRRALKARFPAWTEEDVRLSKALADRYAAEGMARHALYTGLVAAMSCGSAVNMCETARQR